VVGYIGKTAVVVAIGRDGTITFVVVVVVVVLKCSLCFFPLEQKG